MLEGCRALGDLSPEERAAIAALGREITCAAGDRIIEDGAAAVCFYLLTAGSVEVRHAGEPVTRLAPGDLFGEMALFNEGVRTGEVRAVEPCTLLSFPLADFCSLVLHHDPAATRLMAALGELMVQRIQEHDADLLRRADRDPAAAASLAEFGKIRRRLLADWALKYHAIGSPGKLSVEPTKPVGTAADLSVAYSPGVAEPCLAIQRNPESAYEYTSRGHLVAVITNGTAVLGLGNIGALAAKPVMEGKAVLFKRFGGLDAFDIEVDEPDPDRFVEVVCALAPTFGGINLEDIRAPECFPIEAECRRRLEIPVFHDDQHGTAIIAGAGLLNALELVEKPIGAVRVVFAGAGAAGFATAKYFLLLGVRRENLVMTDIHGVVYRGRGDGNYLDELAADTDARTLGEALNGADAFVGVAAPNLVTPAMLRSMNRDPIVFALANPVPEIDYALAHQTRDDVILATGRSDYPNQINNVLAFPYLFRGALDVRARAINEEMKLAATHALAALARDPAAGRPPFGREAIIPPPFDPRLLSCVAPAVAAAAAASGVARIPMDPEEYRRTLERRPGIAAACQ
jgi:malate dehydrogenase (oxaloacetate-decarboxylating)(NADP+)